MSPERWLVLTGTLACCAACGSDLPGSDAIRDDELVSPSDSLLAEGYQRVGTEIYKREAVASDSGATMVCVHPASPNGLPDCYMIRTGGDYHTVETQADRYEHPDGRIAFVADDKIIGPIKRGTYTINGGWLSGYDCKVSRKPYYVAYSVEVVDFHAFSQSVLVKLTGPNDQFMSGFADPLAKPFAVVDGDAVLQPSSQARTQKRSARIAVSFDAGGAPASLGINDVTADRYGAYELTSTSFFTLPDACSLLTCRGGPVVRQKPEGTTAAANGNVIDCHGPEGLVRGRYALPRWDAVTGTCDPNDKLVFAVNQVAHCEKFLQFSCDYTWTRAYVSVEEAASTKSFTLEIKHSSLKAEDGLSEEGLFVGDGFPRATVRADASATPRWIRYGATPYGNMTASPVPGCEPERLP